MKSKLTPFSKLLLVGVIVGGIAAAIYYTPLRKYVLPDANSQTSGDNDATVKSDDKTIKIGVVTWGGYAGGEYFNEGFKPNNNSRFYKDYGFTVDFKVLDDFNASRNAWKADEVDLLWTTVDAFTTEVNGLQEFDPQIIFQADWSRGGDAVVVRRGINKVSDLKGKKVAFAEMTPSHTFLLWLLEAGNMTTKDIELVKVASAIDAADVFKKGQVDAAIVWSPDDQDCITKVSGAKILQSSREASYIIADCFIVKKAYLEKNRKKLKQLVEGWFKGAAEINSSEESKKKAAKILFEGLTGVPEDWCITAINNTRLCTYGDNVNFYNLKGNFTGVTGETIWNKMETKYQKEGYITGKIPNWRMVGNSSLIGELNMTDPNQAAEGAVTFTAATEEVKTSEAVSTKSVSISFASGSYVIDDNMKYIIDNEFLDIAKSFANSRIRIEGNTDNVGSAEANRELSRKRAQAVADYLINEQHFDRNRFIIIGNGPDKPVASNNTADGKSKNRRTDFELVK